jgi:benzodiazapine receptor
LAGESKRINVTRADLIKAPISILASVFIGFAGNVFNFEALATWYPTLLKPFWTPPNEAFFPVWTTLFVLMGIATFFVWRKGFEKREVKIAIGVFVIQFALNLMWSWAFFGLQNILAGLIVIIILWFAILATIIVYAKVTKLGAALLIPYIIWVSIATALNLSIFLLN